MRRLFSAAVLVALLSVGVATAQENLLPDIVIRRSDLFDNDIRVSGGRTLLRVSNGTPNIGRGKLYLYGVTPGNGDGTQDVRQRVFRTDGSFFDRVAGRFIYHSTHNHIHVDGWAQYNLRAMLPGGGVGEIVAQGEKTSFCILDLAVHDRNLPGFNPAGEFRSCSTTIQGLSVGWLDIYDKSLPGQNIDITDVPDGFYWLESMVDPDNTILEANEENNVERIQVTIGNPQPFLPDAYEPNDTPSSVDARPEGGPNSPNLGPCNPKREVEHLTIHQANNPDYFHFYSNHQGGPGDFVRIDFLNSQGNLDITLLNDNLQQLASSATSGDFERISLDGVPEGWYYVRVVGRSGALSGDYMLTVNPPSNQPPAINVLAPEAGNVTLLHGFDNFVVEWHASDPESDQTWVSVYVNAVPELDGNEFLVPTTHFTAGEMGFVVINSAEILPGAHYFYCEITDGGSTTGAWSQGTVTFLNLPAACRNPSAANDCNRDGVSDQCEIDLGIGADCNANDVLDECEIASGSVIDDDGNGVPDACQAQNFHRGDTNGDGLLDISDGVKTLVFLFAGDSAPGCLESADTNNSGGIDLSDAVGIFLYLFLGGDEPASPGPPRRPCGLDPEGAFLGCLSYTGC
jgi:hypothetical protein